MSMGQAHADDLASHRLVVVLQADEACWFRWSDGELLDSFVEPIREDPLHQGIRCPWISGDDESPQQQVELVLDTTLDELDKVKVDGLSKASGMLQRWRLKQRLKRDYPDAVVHDLPSYMAPEYLSIHHQIIPDAWCVWLSRLQESHVTLSHVVTSAALLSQVEHGLGRPVLYCLSAGREQRHLLIDERVPLFMRLLSLSDEGDDISREESPGTCSHEPARRAEADDNRVSNTLKHITDAVLSDASEVSVLTPWNTDSTTAAETHGAFTLSALCVNAVVDFSQRSWADGKLLPPLAEPLPVQLPTRPRRVSSWLNKRLLRAGMMFPPMQSTSLNPQFGVSVFRPSLGGVLKPSVVSSLLRQRINALRHATVLCAAMATITVAFAAVHGVNSARQRAMLSEDEVQLAGQNVHLANTLDKLHPSAAYISESLQRIRAYQSVQPLGTRFLLETVASAITDFPALVLDTLSWSVINDKAPANDAFVVHANMPGRDQLWTTETKRSQIQIELSGAVQSEQGLRDQQSALSAFVAYLEAVPGISRVNVLESPVHSARSSEDLDQAGARYRLSLVLSKS